MKCKTFMLIAGEASGDWLAAELVGALHDEFARAAPVVTQDYQPLYTSLEPRFFGAGGSRMAAAGVELDFDLTQHSIVGLSEVVKNYFKFRRFFRRLYHLALEREPDVIICVDFSGFNRRFAHAIRSYTRTRRDWFHDWTPRLVQYVSPQVWASRPGRTYQMARDYDLLLCLFPFEQEWYARRVPQFRVECVGHPLIDRHTQLIVSRSSLHPSSSAPLVVLLPGSRSAELKRHVPIMLGVLAILRRSFPNLRARMVLPDAQLAEKTRSMGMPNDLPVQAGGLSETLAEADLAIAKTGTVTLECALFGVPTVTTYKTSWSTYQIAKPMVQVEYLSQPNLLANEEIFPEFIQEKATPENIAKAALELLRDERRRALIKEKLAQIIADLGRPGASQRAARAILRLLEPSSSTVVGLPAEGLSTIAAAVEET